MYRAILINPNEDPEWIHLPTTNTRRFVDQSLDGSPHTITLAVQLDEMPEIALATVKGADEDTHDHNPFATSVAKRFGTDWDVYGPAMLLAVYDGQIGSVHDAVWTWVVDVESGMVAAPVTLKDTSPTIPVLADIHVERMRQLAKWGDQHREDGTGGPVMRHAAFDARDRCNYLAENGGADWRAVLLEEVYEALAEDDPAKLRAELVQAAAVCVAWIEDIDSRTAAK